MESVATTSVSDAIFCTFIGALWNKIVLAIFVNVTFLIVNVWSQITALSHLAGVVAGRQFGYCKKCLYPHTIVPDVLEPLSKYGENEPSVLYIIYLLRPFMKR